MLEKNTLKSASMGECQQWQGSHKTRKSSSLLLLQMGLGVGSAGQAWAVLMGR